MIKSILKLVFIVKMSCVLSWAVSESKGYDGPLNLFFLNRFFSAQVILKFVEAHEHHSPLFRLPACGRGATEEDYLNAICISLGIGLKRGWNMKIVPEDCETLEDQYKAISIIYEYLYKLELYGFGKLIPDLVKKIESKAMIPGSAWLNRHWRKIRYDKRNLRLEIPTDTD